MLCQTTHVVRETSQMAAIECSTDVYASPEVSNTPTSFSTDFVYSASYILNVVIVQDGKYYKVDIDPN